MKFEKTEISGWKAALRGMRNPMDSWDRADSYFENGNISIGPNDLKLCKQLINSGSEHRKFLRMIQISVDITAPLYWWKEMDTYKTGTVCDSTSTMHKIQAYPITHASFQIDYEDTPHLAFTHDVNGADQEETIAPTWNGIISILEGLRNKYNEIKKEDPETAKKYWRALIQMLPEAYLQKRTFTMSYENAYNMYNQRKNHKLTEWSVDFVNWVNQLPYFKEFFLD